MDDFMNMFAVFNGWLATVLVTHSALSIFFACFLGYLFILMVWMQLRNPEFDILDIVYSYDKATKKKALNTAKCMLVGSFITSSYYIIQHGDNNSLGVYLLAWVGNGGIYAYQMVKTHQKKTDLLGQEDEVLKQGEVLKS